MKGQTFGSAMRTCFAFLGLVLTTSVAGALPPEGFENVTLLGRGTASKYYSAAITHQKPIWRSSFQSAQYYFGLPVGSDYFTAGVRSSITPSWGDRDAYFLRYDFVMLKSSSFSFKWMHENWRYISTSKESAGFEYNLFYGAEGRRSGVYLSLGYYHRWLKQAWNDPWWSPFNLDTQDQEGYATFTLGWQTAFGTNGSYFTVDMNSRDPYSYYTMDNIAFDLGLNFNAGKFIVRTVVGMRTSALFMGTGAVSEYYGSLGIVSY